MKSHGQNLQAIMNPTNSNLVKADFSRLKFAKCTRIYYQNFEVSALRVAVRTYNPLSQELYHEIFIKIFDIVETCQIVRFAYNSHKSQLMRNTFIGTIRPTRSVRAGRGSA